MNVDREGLLLDVESNGQLTNTLSIFMVDYSYLCLAQQRHVFQD